MFISKRYYSIILLFLILILLQINFAFAAISISETIEPDITTINGIVYVYGNISHDNGTKIPNNLMSAYINETRVVSSEWWDDSWDYRTEVILTENSGSNLTDFQVNISIDTSSLISAGKMNGDCSDIRFTDIDANPIDFYFEDDCNSTNTDVWLKLNLTKSSNKTVFMYYGNSGATTNKNATNVFDLFDDFEDGTLDISIWDKYGTVTETGGYAFINRVFGAWSAIRSKESFGTNTITEYSIQPGGNWGDCSSAFTGLYDPAAGLPAVKRDALDASIKHIGFGQQWCNWASWDMCAGQANGASREGQTVGRGIQGLWSYMKIKRKSSSSELTAIMGTTHFYNNQYSTYNPSGDLDLFLGLNHVGGGWCTSNVPTVQMYVYWARVRKFVDTEPTFSIGVEQHKSESKLQTDANGEYNLTIIAPSTPGDYIIKVNTTYESFFAENQKTLTVKAGPEITDVNLLPEEPEYLDYMMIQALITDLDNNIVSVNFTVINPNGTVILNEQGINDNGIWNSSYFQADVFGFWNYSIYVIDEDGFSDIYSGTFEIIRKPQILSDTSEWNVGTVEVLDIVKKNITLTNNGTANLAFRYNLPLYIGSNETLEYGTDYIATSEYYGRIYYIESNKDGTFKTHQYITDVGSYSWGCAIADFDNDGDYDIVTGRGDSICQQYFLRFNSPGSFTLVNFDNLGSCASYTMDMATADFNNDGNYDYVVSGNNNVVHLFLGNGDGTFSKSIIQSVGGSTYRGKDAADFNEDGNMDFALADGPTGDLHFYLGYGNGSFYTKNVTNIGQHSYGVTAGDFDNDGHMDLITADVVTIGKAYFYKGDGKGNLEYVKELWDDNRYNPVDSFDFNYDNILDLAYTQYDNPRLYYRQGLGNASFGGAVQLSNAGTNRMGVCTPPSGNSYIIIPPGQTHTFELSIYTSWERIINDSFMIFSNDEKNPRIDIPVYVNVVDSTNPTIENKQQSPEIITVDDTVTISAEIEDNFGISSVYLNYTIDGTWTTVAMSIVSGNNYSVAIGPFATMNDLSYKITAIDTFGNVNTTNIFTYDIRFPVIDIIPNSWNAGTNYIGDNPQQEFEISNYGNSVLTTYVTFPGRTLSNMLDENYCGNDFIISGDYYARSWYAKINHDGTFSSLQLKGDLGSYIRGAGVADFDSDGDCDFVVGDSSNNIYLYKQTTEGSFTGPIDVGDFNSNGYGMDIATADFNNDGFVDFVNTGNNDDLYLFLGDGFGNFERKILTLDAPGLSGRGKDAGDINEDGNMDFIYAEYNTGNVYLFLGDGTGNFNYSYLFDTYGSSNDPYGTTLADFDGDSHLDIISLGGGGGDTRLWLGDGTGSFTYSHQVFDFNNHGAFDNYDFDSDGDEDILVSNYGGYQVFWFSNNGSGYFTQQPNIGSPGYFTLGNGAPDDTNTFLIQLQPNTSFKFNASFKTDLDQIINKNIQVKSNDPDNSSLIIPINADIDDITDPIIIDVTEIIEVIHSLTNIEINATISDNSYVANVILNYSTNMVDWTSLTMNKIEGTWQDGKYTATIPYTNDSTSIYYRIFTNDRPSNTDTSSIYNYSTSTPPVIDDISHNPVYPNVHNLVDVTADITDDKTIVQAEIIYATNVNFFNSTTLIMNNNGSTYYNTIPGYPETTKIWYKIYSIDNDGFDTESNVFSYTNDGTKPNISSVEHSPQYPNATTEVKIISSIVDNVGMDNVLFYYKYDNGSWIEINITDSYSKILYVDDDRGKNSDQHITNALDALEYQYDTHNVQTQGSPSASLLNQYNIVIWMFDNYYNDATLSSAERSAIQNFLTNGGNLFIGGGMIGYDSMYGGDQWHSWLQTWFKASYYTYYSGARSYTGRSNDDIGQGLSFTTHIGDYHTSLNYNYNSIFNEISPAQERVYENAASRPGIQTYGGNYKVALAGFTVADVNGASNRQKILERVLDFLDYGYQTIIPAPNSTAEVEFYLSAEDLSGNIINSSLQSYIADGTAPIINTVSDIFGTVNYQTPVSITSSITENQGFETVSIYYSFDNSTWNNVIINYTPQTGDNYTFEGEIPASGITTTVYYYIYAKDLAGNSDTSIIKTYESSSSPIIDNISVTPAFPNAYINTAISANITDDGSVSQAILNYSLNQVDWFTIMMVNTNSIYSADIPPTFNSTNVYYRIIATDNLNFTSISGLQSYFSDGSPPYYSIVQHNPNYPNADNGASITTDLSDNVGIKNSTLYYNYIDINGSWYNTQMNFASTDFPIDVPYIIDSPHNYPNYYDNWWTITELKADKIRVHFTTIQTESCCDTVYIYDKNNVFQTFYRGSYSNIYTPWVDGDTIKIRLVTDYSVVYYGFHVDKYQYAGITSIIPASIMTTNVSYYYDAYDLSGNFMTSDTYNYYSDGTDPIINYVENITEASVDSSVSIEANVTDNQLVDNVNLYYRVNGSSFTQLSMSPGSDIYTTQIPATVNPALVDYYVNAVDVAGNQFNSSLYSYLTANKPVISNITYTPQNPNLLTNVNVSAIITAQNNVQEALIAYSYDGIAWFNLSTSNDNDLYYAEITPPGATSLTYFYIYARDQNGYETTSSTDSFTYDGDLPVILTPTLNISHPSASSDTEISVEVTDNLDLDNVQLYYSYDNFTWESILMTSNSNYKANIPRSNTTTNIYYYIIAEDISQNSKTSQTYSYYSPEMDLIVEEINIEGALEYGNVVILKPRIKNIGSGNVGSSYAAILVDDVVLQVKSVPSLNSSQSSTVESFWTVEAGIHTIKAIADYYGNYIESNETNNELEITPSNIPYPDLTINNVYVDEVCDGETTNINANITNIGADTNTGFYVKYYINGIYLASSYVPDLLTNESTIKSVSWIVTPGNHNISVVLDSSNLVEESNENNNEYTTFYNKPYPNLEILHIDVPASISDGESTAINVTILNNGQCTERGFYVAYYVGSTFVTEDYISGLGTSESIIKEINMIASPSALNITAEADYTLLVTESNETNNIKTTILPTIDYANLKIKSIGTSPITFSDGETVSLLADLSNIGSSTHRTFNVRFEVDGILLGTETIDGLDSNFNLTLNKTWTASPGTHTINVTADYNNQVAESDESNSLTFITPAVTAPDTIITELNITPSTGVSDGDQVTLTAVVENLGGDTSRYFNIGFFVNNVLIGTEQVKGLNSAKLVEKTWTASGGQQNITAVTDYFDVLEESNESNNNNSITTQVLRPNLIVTNISWSQSILGDGDSVTFNVTIKNTGSSTQRDFYVFYKLDNVTIGFENVDGMESGSTKHVHLSQDWTALLGTYTIEAYVDENELIPEENETDNNISKTFEVFDLNAPILVDISPSNNSIVQSPPNVTLELSDEYGSGVDIASSNLVVNYNSLPVVGVQTKINNTIVFVPTTSFTDGNYSVEVTAKDQQANQRIIKTNFIVDETPPDITITGVSDDTDYEISVTPIISITDLHLDSYSIVLNGSVFTSGTTINTDGAYSIIVTGTDLAGNFAETTIEFTIDLPPAAPTGLSLEEQPTTNILTWNSNTEKDIDGYNVYRNGSILSFAESISYSDNVNPDDEYFYQVSALDLAGHESELANISPISIKLLSYGINNPGISYLTRGFVDKVKVNISNNGDNFIDINFVRFELIDSLGNIRYTTVSDPFTVLSGWSYPLEKQLLIDEDLSTKLRVIANLTDKAIISVFSLNVRDAEEQQLPSVTLMEGFPDQIDIEFTNQGSAPLYIDPEDIIIYLRNESNYTFSTGRGIGSLFSLGSGQKTNLSMVIYTPTSVDNNISLSNIHLSFDIPTKFNDGNYKTGPEFSNIIDAQIEYQTASPITVYRSAFVRGGRTNFTLSLANYGSSDLTVNPNNVRVHIRDLNGTLIAQGASIYSTRVISPGLSEEFSLKIDLPLSVPDFVVLDTEITARCQDDICGPITYKSSSYEEVIDPEYDANALTDKSTYKPGDTVFISGIVTSNEDGSSVPFADVRLKISSGGFIREFYVEADASGQYSYSFKTLSNEAGKYIIGATHPIVTAMDFDAEFEIVGVILSPREIVVGMSQNSQNSVPIFIENLGATTVTGINLQVIDNETSISGTVSENNFDLTPQSSKKVLVTISAGLSTPEEVLLTITADSDQGSFEPSRIRVQLFPATPSIKLDPPYAQTGLNTGNRIVKTITVTNTGYGNLDNANLVRQSLPWITILSNTSLGDFEKGESKTFDIAISPDESIEAGIYEDTILIQSNNHATVDFDIRVIVTPNATGDLRFVVKTEVGDPLPNAEVLIVDQKTTTISMKGITDENGLLTFIGIPIGRYSYFVDIPLYDMESGDVLVEPGAESLVEIFSYFSYLKVEWEVVPTTIVDVYEIRHNITYDTKAPVPYVQAEGLPNNLVMVPGATYHGQVILKNMNDEVSAFNGTLDFWAESELIHIEWLVDDIPEIKPGEEIVVPYVLKLAEHHSPKARTCNQHKWHFTTKWTKTCYEYESGGQWKHIYVNTPADGYTLNLDVFCIEAYPDTALCIAEILGGEVGTVLSAVKFGVIDLPGTVGNCLNVLRKCIWRASFYNINTGAQKPKDIKKDFECRNDFIGCTSGVTNTPVPFHGCFNAAYKWGNCMLKDSCAEEEKKKDPDKPDPPGKRPPSGKSNTGQKETNDDRQTGGGGGGGGGPLKYYFMAGQGGGGGLQAFLYNMPPPAKPGRCTASPEIECIRAQINIDQEATLERQAFDATLKLTNLRTDYDMTDMSILINITDSDGNPADDKFFIDLKSLSGIDNIENGTIVPGDVAKMKWLFIPVPGAGGNQSNGTEYKVKAQIRYNVKNYSFDTSTWPDYINVFPMPLLVLDYFLPKTVYGDDLFTPNITESPIPFIFGVRVNNSGHGPAVNLAIDSAQPKIVKQTGNVELDFAMIATWVNGVRTANSLKVNFGDILPYSCVSAGWEMVSRVKGNFSNYTASFTHSDALGGEATSLIQRLETHTLVKAILKDLPDDDNMFDFLVDTTNDNIPETIFDSECTDEPITTVSGDINSSPSYENPAMEIQLDNNGGGEWIFSDIIDPQGNNNLIESFVRSDGKVINEYNYWMVEGKIFLVDHDTTKYYTVTYNYEERDPDLTVTDLTFDPSTPTEDDNVTVNVTVKNLGNLSVNLDEVNVSINISDYYDSKIINLTGKTEMKIIFDWTSLPGSHDIIITVDPNDLIAETDEDNNQDSSTIIVTGVAVCDDNDADGFGVCPNCGTLNGCAYEGDDCDDNSSEINPNAAEIVADGIDQNCDGFDDCYQDNDLDSFGSSLINTSNDLDCVDSGESNNSNDCDDTNGSINPAALEICNGVNDDCNASTDDGMDEAWYNNVTNCGLGECAATGNLVCSAGVLDDTCTVGTPSNELCDGLDNDCDGSIADDGSDETWFGNDCDGSDTDLCTEGTYICSASTQTCTDNTSNNQELCNGLDDDCNVATNDGMDETWFNQVTNCGIGECLASGNLICTNGTQEDTCLAGTPSAELCDNLDNDCDGSITDDGVDEAWYNDVTNCGVGECAATGNLICSAGAQNDTCTTGTPTDEICDGLDNDCDGSIADDGFDETWYNTSCDGVDSDLCEEGNLQCIAGSQSCSDNTSNDLELCNGVDDDCNAATDDGIDEAWFGASCDGTDTDLCEEGTYLCQASSQTCSDYTSNNLELCNNLDDDCNAATEDGVDETWYNQITNCGIGECAATGNLVCSLGSQNDTCTPGLPLDEVCDNLDNDCDGNIDENGASLCDDNVSCTDDSCLSGTCQNAPNNNFCDNNLFCDGIEYCDATLDCQSGTAPNIDDGVNCTVDTCDETNDIVVNTPNDGLCDNSLFCDGTETCHATLDCQSGTPLSTDDGIACTDDSCDEDNDLIVNTPNDSYCDNSLFCDGVETCDAINDCQNGTAPITNDNISCTDDSCDEVNDVIVNNPNDSNCDNGEFCDGIEYCDATLDCQSGTPPNIDDNVACTDDSCDEINDTIVNTPNNANCDDSNECTQNICDAIDNCIYPYESAGTECGLARDCPDDACNGFFAEFYPVDGHDTCDGSGNCQVYSCALEDSYCTDNDNSDGVNTLECGASCDQDSDCIDKCVGDTYYFGGTCDTVTNCDCNYSTEDCNLQDGYYDTNTTQWISTGECIEKEQKEQEYREYTCSVSGCQYSITTTQWIDTGNFRPKPDGLSCNDGLYCTVDDECSGGVCSGTARDCSALDDQCNQGVCDEDADSCVKDPTPYEGLYCNDGLFCNIDETCQSGICNGGIARDCSDSVNCTEDSCSEASNQCVNTPNDGLCDNNQYCDGVETCHATLDCQAGTPLSTDDGISCTDDSCDEVNDIIVNTPNNTNCDDSNECTQNICDAINDCEYPNEPSGTECGNARDCLDDSCNGFFAEFYPNDGHDTCNGLGACIEYSCALEDSYCSDNDNTDGINTLECGASCDQDSDCNDSNPLTNESCLANCTCEYIIIGECLTNSDCSHLDDQCNDGICQDMYCEQQPKSSGTSCNDGLFCNLDETCQAGVCTGGIARDCSDGVNCTGDICDEDTDQCVNAPNDSFCDNNLFCDGTETCDAINDCQAGSPVVCDDSLYCNGLETCNEDTDSCDAGTAIDCNDNVGCTDDSCNEGTDTCDITPNNANCDNGEFCDGAEICHLTLDCQAGTPPSTDDGISCTDDSCDEVNDIIVNAPNNANCDDSNECTQNICDAINDCEYPNEPSGTECGLDRDCPDDSCNGFFAEFYPNDGHDTCNGLGACIEYSCALEDSYCSDNDNSDGINDLTCNAPCDQDSDCNDTNPLTQDYCADNCTCNYVVIECLTNTDCDHLDDQCNDGVCQDYQCISEPKVNGTSCDDGLYCTEDDICTDGTCESGTPKDCSGNDIPAILTCTNDPDDNPFTLDYFGGFISVCDEGLDICTTGTEDLTHSCNITECNAECESVSDCPPKCTAISHKLYTNVECNDCECDYSLYQCVVGECGAECDEDEDCGCEDDYCDGSTLVDYPDYGRCGTAGTEGCICQNDTGSGGDCEPTLISDHPLCGEGMETEIDEGISMFSLPLDSGSPVTFDDVNDDCDLSETDGIAYWDPTINDSNKYVYLNSADQLFAGQGYFIITDDDCTLTTYGQEYDENSGIIGYLGSGIIKTGWNKIASPTDGARFKNIRGNCTILSGPWDYRSSNNRYYRVNKLKVGNAYYIYAYEDCQLGSPTSTSSISEYKANEILDLIKILDPKSGKISIKNLLKKINNGNLIARNLKPPEPAFVKTEKITLIEPENGTGIDKDERPTFSWDSTDNGLKYKLEVSTEPAFPRRRTRTLGNNIKKEEYKPSKNRWRRVIWLDRRNEDEWLYWRVTGYKSGVKVISNTHSFTLI